MNEEFFIKLLKGLNTLTGELLEAIEGADAAPPVEVVDEPKKTRKPKAKKEEPVEDEEVADDMGFGDEEETEEDAPSVTIDEVRDAFKSFVAKHKDIKAGREAAMKVLTKYKAKKVDDLDEAVYSEVIELLKKKK